MDSDEIDWVDYNVFTDEWQDRWLEHTVQGCNAMIQLTWYDVGSIIDEAKTHHEICPLRG